MRQQLSRWPLPVVLLKEWYSAAELAGLPGMPGTPRGVNKIGERGEIMRQKKQKGKGWEYHISSLPQETQAYLRGYRIVTMLVSESPQSGRLVRVLAKLLRPVVLEILREMWK